MRKTYQYKLLLTASQRQEIDRWLAMLRAQYNYLLRERFEWWEYNRSYLVIPQGEYCLRWCELGSGELKDNPDWHSQSASLPSLKETRPWYKNIYSQVLQDCVKRVKLALLQRKLEDKNRSKKAKKLVLRARSRLHQKIARQRKHWHYNEAHKLARSCQVLVIEDLSIRNMKRRNKPKKVDGVFVPNGQAASSGMNKSWSDNGVANFLEILSQVAQKHGTRIVKVNPKGTSQHCSRCLNRVSKTLSDRWHSCDVCQLSCDRDYNSAALIKKLAVDSSQDKTLPSLKDIMG